MHDLEHTWAHIPSPNASPTDPQHAAAHLYNPLVLPSSSLSFLSPFRWRVGTCFASLCSHFTVWLKIWGCRAASREQRHAPGEGEKVEAELKQNKGHVCLPLSTSTVGESEATSLWSSAALPHDSWYSSYGIKKKLQTGLTAYTHTIIFFIWRN